MTGGDGERRPAAVYAQGLLAITAILALPMLGRELIWLHSLVPLPVFYYLVRLGQWQGGVVIAAAVLLAGVVAMMLGMLPLLLFAITLVPVGVVLARGVKNKETPSKSGLKAAAGLGSLWLLAGFVYAGLAGTSPYQEILQGLEQGFAQTLAHYQGKTELPPETLKELTAAVEMLRRFFARAFPAVLAGSIISTVWLNMLAGQWLLKRYQPDLTPWPELKNWRLPEQLIWLVIVAMALLVSQQEPLATIGLNGGYVLGILYFMQGLAITSHALARWQTPRLFRGVIYLLLVVQIYGLILLAAIGLADTWLDLRKLATKPAEIA